MLNISLRGIQLSGSSFSYLSDPTAFHIITGANNSGKSTFLHELFNYFSGQNQINYKIIKDITVSKEGNTTELIDYLLTIGVRRGNNWSFQNISFVADFSNFFEFAGAVNIGTVVSQNLTTTTRLTLASPPQQIDYATEVKSHPLHHLYMSEDKRALLSKWFRRAFGTEIAVDMVGGRVIPLHVGPGAELRDGEHFTDQNYLDRLRALPRLDEQGDGMKCFVGILLNVICGHQFITFLDEPEAFLHPPQARLLGRLLGEHRPAQMQLFVATHSSDFVRGSLESGDEALRVSRIIRETAGSKLKDLNADDFDTVWSDPVLRFSNVIEGLFHEKVVIAEADGDCRFYGAIADALRNDDNHVFTRDIMFAQAGGKGGVAKIVRALRALSVPVCVAVDFDVLRQVGQLRSIIEALGGRYDDYIADIKTVRDNIDNIGKTSIGEIKTTIQAELAAIPDDAVSIPPGVDKRIRDAMKVSPGWARAKTTGLGILDKKTRPIGERLLNELKIVGLYIVPVGEIESFETSVSGDKNIWVTDTIAKHQQTLNQASELEEARKFVSGLISKAA